MCYSDRTNNPISPEILCVCHSYATQQSLDETHCYASKTSSTLIRKSRFFDVISHPAPQLTGNPSTQQCSPVRSSVTSQLTCLCLRVAQAAVDSSGFQNNMIPDEQTSHLVQLGRNSPVSCSFKKDPGIVIFSSESSAPHK